MELFISADHGKTWYFARNTDWGSKDTIPYEKAGYAVRVLSPVDCDYQAFRARVIFPSSDPLVNQGVLPLKIA